MHLARMQVAELLPDRDDPTKVETPSGIRRRGSAATINFKRMAAELIASIERRPLTIMTEALLGKLHRLHDEFDAWHTRAPTPEDRIRWMQELTDLQRQALDCLMGGRQ